MEPMKISTGWWLQSVLNVGLLYRLEPPAGTNAPTINWRLLPPRARVSAISPEKLELGVVLPLRELPPFFLVLVSVLVIQVRQRFATSFSLYWLSSCFVLCSIVRGICDLKNSENEHDFIDLRYIEPMTSIWAKLLWLGWMWIIYRDIFQSFRIY